MQSSRLQRSSGPASPRKGLWLVAGQVVLAAALVLTTRPSSVGWTAGVMMALGVAIGAWAIITMGPGRVSVRPELHDRTELVTSPPYDRVRHPMYTGLLLMTLGCAIAPAMWWRIGLWLLLSVLLDHKARYEEQMLRAEFPEYAEYMRRSRRFLPLLY